MRIPDEAAFAGAIALWREWNARINVVSRKDEDGLFAHHILHSLAIAEYLERFYPETAGAAFTPDAIAAPGCRGRGPSLMGGASERPARGEKTAPAGKSISILDLGTGGGFPGIPLAMEMPGAQFTLCDSIGKKVKVAQAVADGLGLKNVCCVHCRAEDLKEEFDWVVTRAVASLSDLYPWVRGRFRCSILCLKGGDVDSEIVSLMAKYRLDSRQIRKWRIDSWLNDEYFAEKFVIEVGKNYLCTPKAEN